MTTSYNPPMRTNQQDFNDELRERIEKYEALFKMGNCKDELLFAISTLMEEKYQDGYMVGYEDGSLTQMRYTANAS